MADQPTPTGDRPLTAPLLALGYLLYGVSGLLLGTLAVTLVPLRHGTALVPVAPVIAVVGGVLLPALARGLTDTGPSALPPVIGQVLGIWGLASGRPEGDVLLPAGQLASVSYAVLLLGTVAPLVTLGLATRSGRWRLPRWLSRPARPGSDSDDAR